MGKVIYICYEPLTAKVERDWYIDYLLSQNVQVEYWDCSLIFYGQRKFVDPLMKDYVVKIENYEYLISLVNKKENQNASYVMWIVYEYKAFKLYRILTHYGCKLYFVRWAVFSQKNRIMSKLIKLPLHPIRIAGRVLDKIFTIVTKKIGIIDPYRKVFYAGSAALSASKDSLKNIPINMCDYDSYVLSKNSPNELPAKNYCVFLDVNLPFHPDFQLLNAQYVTPQRYIDAINKFFEFVEKKFGINVVIAGHPTSDYHKDTFSGRKILKYLTSVLVRDARFVISHHSASMNFAILNKIPIIFIYTNEMKRLYSDSIMTIINGSAEFLNAALYNIDMVTSTDDISMQEVDEERYNLYKYNFLTSKESEGTLSQEIFFREIVSD